MTCGSLKKSKNNKNFLESNEHENTSYQNLHKIIKTEGSFWLWVPALKTQSNLKQPNGTPYGLRKTRLSQTSNQ
jgi:hypothetical protein